MGKTAFLFAGQGSQYSGMGKELYDNYAIAREIYDKAAMQLDFDIKKLCFDGPDDELSKTEYTQACMLTTAYAIVSVLKEQGIDAEYAAGLSLGEYSALVFAGVISFEHGLNLIRKRGLLMQEAVPKGKGGMAAIMGLDTAVIEAYCKSFTAGLVEVANYNCPGQIVITGEKEAVEKAASDLKLQGAMKTVVLNVSGPFHSSMLTAASTELEQELERIDCSSSEKKVLSNYDNEFYNGQKDNMIYKLKNQICSPVRWEDNVRKLIADGVDTFIEIGPGKTLGSFMKKIDKSKTVFNVEDQKTLEKLLAALAESK